MKILSIGGGSMGRRRLRDLTYLNKDNVILFEPLPDRCKEISTFYNIQGFTDFDQALEEKPEVMTISTPPALHEKYVLKAMDLKMHVFSELPFVLDVKTIEGIASIAKTYPKVLGISHTIRYYPPSRLIHDVLQ